MALRSSFEKQKEKNLTMLKKGSIFKLLLGRYFPGHMAVRMRQLLAIPWVNVSLAFKLFFQEMSD